jgi:hypothetical protein
MVHQVYNWLIKMSGPFIWSIIKYIKIPLFNLILYHCNSKSVATAQGVSIKVSQSRFRNVTFCAESAHFLQHNMSHITAALWDKFGHMTSTTFAHYCCTLGQIWPHDQNKVHTLLLHSGTNLATWPKQSSHITAALWDKFGHMTRTKCCTIYEVAHCSSGQLPCIVMC